MIININKVMVTFLTALSVVCLCTITSVAVAGHGNGHGARGHANGHGHSRAYFNGHGWSNLYGHGYRGICTCSPRYFPTRYRAIGPYPGGYISMRYGATPYTASHLPRGYYSAIHFSTQNFQSGYTPSEYPAPEVETPESVPSESGNDGANSPGRPGRGIGTATDEFAGSGGSETSSTADAIRPSTPADDDSDPPAGLAGLSASDRALAESQGFCPVLVDRRLGSMGTPVKVMIEGQPVFVCCNGCKKKALANPEDTLATIEELKLRTSEDDAPVQQPSDEHTLSPESEQEIQQALAELSPQDRRLAEQQKFCAVLPSNRLGSMGVPVKVMVNGKPVFVCCEGCTDETLNGPSEAE